MPELHSLVRTIDARKRLQQIMFLDHTVQVQFLQSRSVKACLQHLKHDQQIDFSVFEQINPFGTGGFIEAVIEDKGSAITPFSG